MTRSEQIQNEIDKNYMDLFNKMLKYVKSEENPDGVLSLDYVKKHYHPDYRDKKNSDV